MSRTKDLNIVVRYAGTDFVINDTLDKSPRFELYNTVTKKVVKKSENPIDFDDYIEKFWQRPNIE